MILIKIEILLQLFMLIGMGKIKVFNIFSTPETGFQQPSIFTYFWWQKIS